MSIIKRLRRDSENCGFFAHGNLRGFSSILPTIIFVLGLLHSAGVGFKIYRAIWEIK